MRVAFRCDGDERIGAGHVSRSIQVAAAFRRAGHEAVMVGRFGGLAAQLAEASGLPTAAPGAGPCGVESHYDAAVVDSYELPDADLASLAAGVPAAALWDTGAPPPVDVLIHYHPGPDPSDVGDRRVLRGPAYAPVSPRFAGARRARGFDSALVSVGGSDPALALVEPAERALEELGGLRVVVAGAPGAWSAGLVDRVREADVAVSAAGATAYELACAGVPSVVVAIVANQRPVAAGLSAVHAVRAVDATTGGEGAVLGEQIAALADSGERERLATRGPEVVDGAGGMRLRDALIRVFAGGEPPHPVGLRPAKSADARQLLEWRSEPSVRAASRSTGAIDWRDHLAWLEGVFADPARTLWLAEDDGRAAGSVRFDRDGGRAEISVSLGEAHRGAGLGTRVIREATELYLAAHPDVRAVQAHIRIENASSLSAFERAGYEPSRSGDQMAVLEATQPAQ